MSREPVPRTCQRRASAVSPCPETISSSALGGSAAHTRPTCASAAPRIPASRASSCAATARSRASAAAGDSRSGSPGVAAVRRCRPRRQRRLPGASRLWQPAPPPLHSMPGLLPPSIATLRCPGLQCCWWTFAVALSPATPLVC